MRGRRTRLGNRCEVRLVAEGVLAVVDLLLALLEAARIYGEWRGDGEGERREGGT